MRIYVSYAEKDRELAQQVGRALSAAGIEASGFITDIYPGENWGTALGNNLETADWCVFLLSEGCVERSDRMRAEMRFVFGKLRYADRVIPIWVDDPQLPNDVPLALLRLPSFRTMASPDAAEVAAEIVTIIEDAAVAN